MKKIKFLIIPALLLSFQAMAQHQTPSDGKVGKTINKIGNKTAEVAVKGASAVGDKKYDSKVGPGGQTIYINKHSRYYYVNGRGKKVYVSKSKLRNVHHR
ncbi:hypothetical protein [Mucilaginibacter paludis]|uniref:PBCV-specific basic adaptor domain-containing protein n=1 Tax=Mucilaginibacter paludis DSM 18603 TaxID=714943 RepID=H1Y9T4_9SPHI|nr:hypothetical protein [Mucilaginibacter paludis]EHQ31117.1 hypothetical protein Mucpa_7074 [Mucilaginibacter paludis DSM 18603]